MPLNVSHARTLRRMSTPTPSSSNPNNGDCPPVTGSSGAAGTGGAETAETTAGATAGVLSSPPTLSTEARHPDEAQLGGIPRVIALPPLEQFDGVAGRRGPAWTGVVVVVFLDYEVAL